MRLVLKFVILIAITAGIDAAVFRPYRQLQAIEQASGRPITPTELAQTTGRPLSSFDPEFFPR